jgi:hypothetical protein
MQPQLDNMVNPSITLFPTHVYFVSQPVMGALQQGEQAPLPKAVATISQLVGAPIEASFQRHLPLCASMRVRERAVRSLSRLHGFGGLWNLLCTTSTS